MDASLYNLGLDYIDLYYQHRYDPKTPLEQTIGTLAELVKEGKFSFIGLSESPADIIRRAQATHPITAVEVAAMIEGIASKKLCTSAQLALAWLLSPNETSLYQSLAQGE